MRKKGSRNKGYWFRKGRGWYVGNDKLLDAAGEHIKGPDNGQAAELAYHTLMANGKPVAEHEDGYTVREVCREYLKEAKAKNSPQTYTLRKRFLYDFCEGKKGVHKGYGHLPITDLIGLHVKQWLDAHNWDGCRRMAYQAVRRAIFYGISLGMVKENPIKGFKADPARKRQAYFTKEVEAAIYETANRALADIIRAMIGTGCRPGEVARLEKRHIEQRDGRMVWRFPPSEHKTGSKTKKDRVVPVCSEIAALVKRRMKWQAINRVFLNSRRKPWTPTNLKTAFARLRVNLAKKGIKLSKDQTLYACRHTYAKRQLGKGISTNVLAAQMGNSPQIAWDHYGKDWDKQADNTAILWSGID
jgi:integrase